MPYSELRKGRYSQIGQVYSVTSVLKNRQSNLFHNFSCARLVIEEMKKLHETKQVSSIAWVIMPDHLHWLFSLEMRNLSNVMKILKAKSTIAINKHTGNNGCLWQPNFYDRAIRTDEDIKSIARYIVANPLRANLVTDIGQYPHWDASWL